MGLFGFPRMLLAFIHRHIFMPIIAWLFQAFIGPRMEPFLVIFPASGYSQIIGEFEGKIRVRLYVWKPTKFCLALIWNFKMGLAESFVDSAWTADPCPKDFISLLIRAKIRRNRQNCPEKLFARCWRKISTFSENFSRLWKANCSNTTLQARKNVKAHYDLGNAIFEQFLDPSMTYSCALFEDLKNAQQISSNPQLDPMALLHAAQMRKYDAILDALGPIEGKSILEIGCGWGAFGIRAVQRNCCKWTGLTLSTEQLKMARERVEKEGLSGKINFELQDYRLNTGLYDHVVAVEMLEAVGHEFLPKFFATCAQSLRPGGKLCIQSILCRDDQYEQYRHSTDFIRRHIFPGGHLPSMAAIRAALPANLEILHVKRMDEHYALTLDIWRNAWHKNRAEILRLGGTEQFHRKWDMYFSLCSALFENHSVHVAQILLQKCQGKEEK